MRKVAVDANVAVGSTREQEEAEVATTTTATPRLPRRRRVDDINMIHPIDVIQREPAEYMQPPPEDEYAEKAKKRRIRTLEKRDMELEELEMDEEIAKKSVSVRQAQAELKSLEQRLGMKNSPDDAEGVQQGARPPQPQEDIIPMWLLEKLAEYPEDKRMATIRTYALVKAATQQQQGGDMMGGGGGGMALPLLLFSQNHDSTDINKYGENLISAIQTGAKMANGGGGGGGEEGRSRESVSDKLVLKAFEMLQERASSSPAPQAGSSLSQVTGLIKELKEAGLVVSSTDMMRMMNDKVSAPGTTATEVELEKIRQDSAIKLQEIQTNQQIEMAKLGIDRDRNDGFSNMLSKGLTTAGRFLAKGETDELLNGGGEAPQGMPAMNDPQQVAIGHEKCPNCGADILVPQPDKPRDDLACAKCGVTGLHYDPPQQQQQGQ